MQQSLEQLQQHEQAIFNYNKAKEIDPYEHIYYKNLSYIYSTLNNQIESQRYKRIAEGLETNRSIEELQLEWNSLLTAVGVNALSDSLKKNKTLTKLSLAECSQVTSKEILYLIEKAPPQLKTIELSEYRYIIDKKKTILDQAKEKNITIIFRPLSWSRYLW